jgi:hypothetical protein
MVWMGMLGKDRKTLVGNEARIVWRFSVTFLGRKALRMSEIVVDLRNRRPIRLSIPRTD